MAKKQTKSKARPTEKARNLFDAKIVVVGIVAVLFVAAVMWSGGKLSELFKGTGVSQLASAPRGDVLDNREWWRWMPGTEWDKGTLRVLPVNFALVNQDGTGEKPNYPINLYGVHAQTTGDFGISASMQDLSPAPASIQFYGEVPVIIDELRIERKSVKLTVQNDVLKIELWDGSSQTPVMSREYSVEPARVHDVSMDRVQSDLIFTVDGRQVGTIQEQDVFKSGQIWIGTAAQTNEWRLGYLRLHQKGRGNMRLVDSSTLKLNRQEAGGLQKHASKKRPGFLVGSAAAIGPSTTDEPYFKRLYGGDFGILTPENEMKMINMQPNRGYWDFKKADTIVELAKKHGIAVHGHTLVFGEANPPWFNSLPVTDPSEKESVQQIMKAHIQTVMSHYKGTIKSWDVINEPLMDDKQTAQNNGSTGFRPHKWYQAMGYDYIPLALETAHKADPSAQLFINEYGLEQDGERWKSFLSFMKLLKPQLEARGVPIKNVGVGLQAHEYDRRDRIDTEELSDHIKELEKLGYKVRISEMDVDLQDGQQTAAEEYASVAETCIESPSCVAWSTWMPTSAYNYFVTSKGEIKKGSEGLYNDSMQPTSSIAEVKNVFK